MSLFSFLSITLSLMCRQLKLIVEDLEKMLALGSPVKEEHVRTSRDRAELRGLPNPRLASLPQGASEIDRQIGEVDEDLLGDDEAPEPDFPLPSQVERRAIRLSPPSRA